MAVDVNVCFLKGQKSSPKGAKVHGDAAGRYFLALSSTLSFTRAAEECNVTQPALTRAIKTLEEGLGANASDASASIRT